MPEVLPLSEYPTRFLDCRVINHPWRPDSNGPWIETAQYGAKVVYEKFTCARCGNVRIDQRTLKGALLRRSYRHQVNFHLTEEQRNRELLARERINRWMKDAA